MKCKDPRSGYAVLLIFCMAAVIAIGLYSRLPRVAFESQRDKEQLLVDRGQQFSRAVSLYVRKFKKFPATIEALEDTNGMRFLRRRYKDPMTGKDEWRIIHVGPNGVFTDSIVYKKKDDKAEQNTNTYIADLGAVNNNPQTAGVNPALRTRPSDNSGAPGTGDPNNPQPVPGTAIAPGINLPPGVGVQGQQGNLLPGQPGPAVTSGTAGNTAYDTTPGANGNTPNPFGGQQPGNTGAAADMIRNLLTSPRPGGLNGVGAGATTQQPTQTTIGGGIAGIASKLEREGIKVFNDRKAYNEWEFVYDMSKDPAMANAGAAAAPATGQRPGQPGQPGQVGNGLTPVPVVPGQPLPVTPKQ